MAVFAFHNSFVCCCCYSVAKSCLTLCHPMDGSTPGLLSLTISRSLPKFLSTEWVTPSNHLILRRPLLLPSIFPSIRVFSIESAVHIRWPKYWSFSFSTIPSNEHSGLVSFRIELFDLLDWFESKERSRVFSSTTVQKHQFFSDLPSLWSNSHIHA